MLGTDCNLRLSAAGHDVISVDVADIDITDRTSIEKCLSAKTPVDFVINCAAYTQVDLCETNQELARLVNGIGAKNLAVWCAENHVPIIHFSTDYVFDGSGSAARSESDLPAPISVYGESKLQGERGVLKTQPDSYVFRIQWLYGSAGPNFIRTLLGFAESRSELKVVNDQWGSPTWARDVADMLVWVLENRPPYGLYHWHNDGYCSWYELAVELARLRFPQVAIQACTTAEFPRPARRPANGRMAIDKFLRLPNAPPPPHWKTALVHFLAEYSG